MEAAPYSCRTVCSKPVELPWVGIRLEWVLGSRGIQSIVVWYSKGAHGMVHRSAPAHGSSALKFTQRQPQPSTFQMGVTRLAVHMWLN